MAVLLQYRAGKGTATHNQYFFVVLFEFFYKGHEVAVAAHNNEGIDVIPRERHFQSIQSEVDVGSIFVAAWREVALDHLDGMLRHAAAVIAGALPVPISDLGDDFAAFLDCLQDRSDIEMAIQSTFDTDFDVVEINKNSDFEAI
jgi:hypothetical protein